MLLFTYEMSENKNNLFNYQLYSIIVAGEVRTEAIVINLGSRLKLNAKVTFNPINVLKIWFNNLAEATQMKPYTFRSKQWLNAEQPRPSKIPSADAWLRVCS